MKSFINYSPDCEFPIENLPYGVFTTADNVSFLSKNYFFIDYFNGGYVVYCKI